MKKISIFLASNNNYAPYLCVTMYSILCNTKSFIDFYILEDNIDEKYKSKIEKSLKRFKNKTIEYLNMGKFNLDKFPAIKHYSTSAFSRYFISSLKPNLEKVIYLDCDIVVNGDIQKLYNQELDGYPIGAISEKFFGNNEINLKESIYENYKGTFSYFNSGVLLIDISKFNKGAYLDELLVKTQELSDKLLCADQDIFNIVFDGNYKLLDYKFNFMPDLKEYYYNTNDFKDIYDERNKNAVVFHYVSGKPWLCRSIKSYLFWRYLLKTQFKYLCISNLLKNKYDEKYKPKIDNAIFVFNQLKIKTQKTIFLLLKKYQLF